jgi:hypothetical protein
MLCGYMLQSNPMASPEDILRAALAAPEKDDMADHLGTVFALRDKKYSWREIAQFLAERGVQTDHTKLLRMYTKHMSQTMNIPSAEQYVQGLSSIQLSDKQRLMLACHYLAHNRTVTYTELAAAAGSPSYRVANSAYGTLGKVLGTAVNYTFPISPSRGEPFYSSSIGIDAPKSITGEYRMMMHHELAKALDTLGWFK